MAAPAPLHGGDASSVGDAAKFGVLTVSDRASGGVYDDLSGPAILQFFAYAVESPWTASYRVVPDEREQIEAAIIDLVRGGWWWCWLCCLRCGVFSRARG
jgi:molybdopterin adenylyltransferase